MKLTASPRSLQADMQTKLRDIEHAVAIDARDAGRGVKTELRRQVASAGLGQRLANSWSDRHYPNQKLDAASLVYSTANADHLVKRAVPPGLIEPSRRAAFLRSICQ
jgi:Family of unknown function (DUF6441)